MKRAKKIPGKRAVFFRSAAAPEPKAGGVMASRFAPSLAADTRVARRARRGSGTQRGDARRLGSEAENSRAEFFERIRRADADISGCRAVILEANRRR